MSPIKIQSIELIDQQISLIFEQVWFQEDIITLQSFVLAKALHHHIKEITHGADRVSIRFLCSKAEFMLHFDYYSQSCWFSPQDQKSQALVSPLFNLLTKNDRSTNDDYPMS